MASTLYAKLLRACIQDNRMSPIRSVRDDFLVGEEKKLHAFVLKHLTRHSRAPSEEALVSGGFTVPQVVEDNVSYYLDRLVARYAYNILNEATPAFAEAMRARDVPVAIEVFRSALGQCSGILSPNSYVNLAEGARIVSDDYEYAREHPGLRGITLGWSVLDEATLGLQGGDLGLLVGRPGTGKTWLLIEMMYQAWRAGHSVALCSMEMSVLPMMRRFVARHCRINPNFIRAGQLSDMGERKLREAITELGQTGSSVNFMAGDFKKDTGSLTEMIDQFDPDLMCVDSAYLLTAEGKAKGTVSRFENIANSVEQIKGVCLGKNKPIMATYQFNRNVKRRQSAREDQNDNVPELSDVGGSDAAPQAASVVVATRLGKPPREINTRRIDLIKNREGESDIGFTINYKFSPIDFSQVIEEDTEVTDAAVSQGWQI